MSTSQTSIQSGDELVVSVTHHAASASYGPEFWTINVDVRAGESTHAVRIFSWVDPGPLAHVVALKAVSP